MKLRRGNSVLLKRDIGSIEILRSFDNHKVQRERDRETHKQEERGVKGEGREKGRGYRLYNYSSPACSASPAGGVARFFHPHPHQSLDFPFSRSFTSSTTPSLFPPSYIPPELSPLPFLLSKLHFPSNLSLPVSPHHTPPSSSFKASFPASFSLPAGLLFLVRFCFESNLLFSLPPSSSFHFYVSSPLFISCLRSAFPLSSTRCFLSHSCVRRTLLSFSTRPPPFSKWCLPSTHPRQFSPRYTLFFPSSCLFRRIFFPYPNFFPTFLTLLYPNALARVFSFLPLLTETKVRRRKLLGRKALFSKGKEGKPASSKLGERLGVEKAGDDGDCKRRNFPAERA
uniref:Transmembrane protein n=1 Tax=Cacopsylla melanoneura TaxID=428564 RepID=A0A8D8TPR0_9HEMI